MSDQLDKLAEYGRALGLAFQVADDILDVEASTEQMGKRTHKDEARGKATYPALLGLEQSREFARTTWWSARIRRSGPSTNAPSRCAGLASFVVERICE